MPDFSTLEYGLKLLRGAVIHDRFTHFDIECSDQPDALVASNFSMQAGKPVCFRTLMGAQKVVQWWTNGVRYNPNGASTNVLAEHWHVTKHTDEHGFPHREDGPALVKYQRGTYTEEWMVHPGSLHRVGGPAYIEVKEHKPALMTWKEYVSTSTYFVSNPYMFDNDQMVRFYDKRTQMWLQNGRPKNGKNGYTCIEDEGVCVITEVTPTLIPKITTIVGLREYRWHNEDGQHCRTDGPAVVRLRDLIICEDAGAKGGMRWQETSATWYYKGRAIDSYEFDQWVKKHGIELIKKPAVETGAFVNPDDEFCFITDFLVDYEPQPRW